MVTRGFEQLDAMMQRVEQGVKGVERSLDPLIGAPTLVSRVTTKAGAALDEVKSRVEQVEAAVKRAGEDIPLENRITRPEDDDGVEENIDD
ncbi:hypothetical protein HDU93_008418 [Gonapodya sp. JEL0774]|nr:hypothetical protein HDU93_008418 [Gonapodya sp. JEL0774]